MDRRTFLTTSAAATGAALIPATAQGDGVSSAPLHTVLDDGIWRATILGVDDVPIVRRVVRVPFESQSGMWNVKVWRGCHRGLFQEDSPGNIHFGRPSPLSEDPESPPHWPRPMPEVMAMEDYGLIRFGDLMEGPFAACTLRRMVAGDEDVPTLAHMVFECADDVRSHAFVYLMEDAFLSYIKLVQLHDLFDPAQDRRPGT